MNFTTFEFLLFLVLFFPIYFLIPKKNSKICTINFYYISFYKVEFLYFILGLSTLFYIFEFYLKNIKINLF